MITLNVDGASKGNPGHAGIGILATAGGQALCEHSAYIGQATNNVAEYHALIKGLEIATELGADHVTVLSDSELIVRQMTGQYRVKNAALFPLYQEARTRARTFAQFAIRHIPRTQNKDADRLANEGIQKGRQTENTAPMPPANS